MSDVNNEVFDWDDEIEDDGGSLEAVPAGKYDFTVDSFERAHYDGGEKIPECHMAIIGFKLTDGTHTGYSTERFFLCRSQEWKLSSLFKACGLKETGKKVRPQWDKLLGSTGRCSVGIREYNGNDYNFIKSFYAAKEMKEDDEWS